MAAHRSTAKQSQRSTDTRSRSTNATVRPTASGREMSPLQLHNRRTRRKQTFVPADPSRQVGLFVCGPTVYEFRHLGHAKTDTHFDFLARVLTARGLAVTYVQNITDVDTRSSAGRASCGSTRPSSRARTSARIWTTCGRCATTPWTCTRAPATTSTKSSARSSACSRRGAAYATAAGIYFDLTAFPHYGRLSSRTNVLRGDPVSRLDAIPTA